MTTTLPASEVMPGQSIYISQLKKYQTVSRVEKHDDYSVKIYFGKYFGIYIYFNSYLFTREVKKHVA